MSNLSRPQERSLLLILAIAQFTNIMDFMIVMPLVDMLTDAFSIGPQEFSFIVASYTISAGVSSFLGTFFLDRFDRKRALLVTYIGFTLGTFACAMADTYTWLLIARFSTGAFGGILGALAYSIVGDAVPNERRAKGMGIVMSAFGAASVLGVPFGLFIADRFDWHAPFWFVGFMGVLVTIAIITLVPSLRGHMNSDQPRLNPTKIISNAFTVRNQRLALGLAILLVMGQFTVIPFMAKYMIRNIGFTYDNLFFIYAIGGGLVLITSPLVGRMADFHGRNKVYKIAALLSLIPIVAVTHLPHVSIWVALIVTSSFFVLVSGRWVPALTMITSAVKPENRGGFLSMNASVRYMSSALASLIAGWVVAEEANGELSGFSNAGYIAVVATLLSLLISGKLKISDSVENESLEKASDPLNALMSKKVS